MKDTAVTNIKEQDCKKHLKYEFEPEELQELGQNLASKHDELSQFEDALKTIKAEYKEKITRVESEISSIVRKVNVKSEYRDIDCFQQWDYDLAIYRVVRKDSGEVVEERALTDEERQMELSDEEEVIIHGSEPDHIGEVA